MVSGASSGVGRATARKLAKREVTLGLADVAAIELEVALGILAHLFRAGLDHRVSLRMSYSR